MVWNVHDFATQKGRVGLYLTYTGLMRYVHKKQMPLPCSGYQNTQLPVISKVVWCLGLVVPMWKCVSSTGCV